MVTKLEGTPQEVAAQVNALLSAEPARQKKHAVALLMVDDAATNNPTPTIPDQFEKLMAEAASDTVSIGHMDDSREAMYTRMEGE